MSSVTLASKCICMSERGLLKEELINFRFIIEFTFLLKDILSFTLPIIFNIFLHRILWWALKLSVGKSYNLLHYPFPTYRHFLTPLQQKTFENIVVKGKITHDEQFPHLPQCFQLFSAIKSRSIEIFYVLAVLFSKSSAADMLYVWKD